MKRRPAMSDEKRKRRDRALSRWLKEILGRAAPIDFQDVDSMAGGDPGKTNAEVVAELIVREACKGERWAIEILADRTEGKPVQAVKQEGEDRSVEERIEDVTVAHLNDLAGAGVGAGPGSV